VTRQKIAEFTQLIRPWSMAAFAVAFLALAGATAVRSIFAHFGATLYFATYFPVILIVSLFAGVPAGVLTAVTALLVVWWAFIPPYYSFNPLQANDYANFLLYGVSTMLIIGLSHLYRTTLIALLQTQRARELLINELNHRAGNLLTVVQAIVKGSLSLEKQDARDLSRRIEALARADDLISRSIEGDLSLEALVTREMAPYPANQISFGGPNIVINGSIARNVALVLHELTTNAVKYGALSSEAGKLDIAWSMADGKCHVRWVEHGGPLIGEPQRIGFGSRMMRASLATVGGSIEQSFDRGGFRGTLTFRVTSEHSSQPDVTHRSKNFRLGELGG